MTKTILITGATDGIGLELARQYKAAGEYPLLLGRRAWADLAALADEFAEADYCRADLADADCAKNVLSFLEARGINQLDMVIHNAGVGFYGRPREQSAESITQLVDVNLAAPIALTHALLPYLREKTGQIAFISSVAADLPAAEYTVYIATKAALDDFARNLRLEQRGKVIVQAIHPGATRTGMHGKMGVSAETLKTDKFPPASKVATQIIKTIASKRPSPTVGASNKLLGIVGRNLSWAIDPLMRRGQAKHNQQKSAIQNSPKVCVITGAADGIGKALAKRYLGAGFKVVGVDVDVERAAQTEAELAGDISFVLADLSTVESVQTAADTLGSIGTIDLLIHNAGISAVGAFASVPINKQRKVIDINLRAPLLLTAALLASQTLQPNARLVFISSLSKHVGYPGAATYGATKAGLAAYARSLRVAFGGKRRVLTVYPGPTRTAHARRYSPDNSREGKRMSPEQLAEAIFVAAEKGQNELIPGTANRVAAVFGRIAPSLMGFAMKKALLDGLDGRVFVEES